MGSSHLQAPQFLILPVVGLNEIFDLLDGKACDGGVDRSRNVFQNLPFLAIRRMRGEHFGLGIAQSL
jgi:hypothetical protein